MGIYHVAAPKLSGQLRNCYLPSGIFDWNIRLIQLELFIQQGGLSGRMRQTKV